MRAGAAHTLEIMRHWPLDALRPRSRTVNIGTRRRYGDSFAHFTIEDFQYLHRVFHSYNFFNVVIVQKKRHPSPANRVRDSCSLRSRATSTDTSFFLVPYILQ